jgi:hypothetical protein
MSGQQVVTELVINADTSGADQFSQSMDKASASAEKGVGSVAGLTLAVAGVGVAFVGSLAALRGFIDYVGNTNKELIDLANNAEKAGMTTKSFQETLFAAKASGLTDKDFVSGLDKIGADLQAASRGATDFGKLFEANGVSIKDANGQLKTTEVALGDISNLIKNAPTLQMANAIASIVGLSKDWVPFLRQGTDAIEDQKKAAASLGVTIDDATIQKAKDFNTQWHTAIATWDMQFKASLAGVLPLLVQAASLASKIIDGVGSISGSISLWMTPDDQKSKQQLNDQAEYATKLIDLQSRFGDSASGFAGLKIQNLQSLLGIPEGSSIDQAVAYLDKLNALYDKTPTKLTVTPTGNGSTVLPATGGDANDPVDRAINQLQKHTESMLADAKAIGLGDAALAGFRADAAETAAVQANGGKETDAQVDKFNDLRDAAVAAAGGLAKAKVESQIEFGGRTAFLSAQDVQIANQLKGIYGNEVPSALSSTYAAAIRVNDAFRQVSSGIENNLVTGLTDIATGSVKAAQGFSNMGLAILKTIEQMIIKIAIVQPMMAALQNSIGGGSILSLLGLGGSNPNAGGAILPFSTGNISVGSYSMPQFADGTDSAPGGLALVGERGPEIVNLPQGSQVMPNGRMPSNDNGRVQNVFNYSPVIDARGADAAAVARIATVVAQDKQNFARNVRGVLAQTRQNNPGAAA